MKIEAFGTLMVAGCFLMIVVWPGLEYWYIGTAVFAVFMIWLAYKTFK
jgi:hypothetical protein